VIDVGVFAAATAPCAHSIECALVMSLTDLTDTLPSTKYIVPATFAVTVTALGHVFP
jgi:hypothetical protein